MKDFTLKYGSDKCILIPGIEILNQIFNLKYLGASMNRLLAGKKSKLYVVMANELYCFGQSKMQF